MKKPFGLSEKIVVLKWMLASHILGCTAGVFHIPGIYLPLWYLVIGVLALGIMAMVFTIQHLLMGEPGVPKHDPVGVSLPVARRTSLKRHQLIKQKKRAVHLS